MHNSHESKVILQRMEAVRGDLDTAVQGIVEGVRDMGDWRSYVRTYPWICLGTVVAAGFVIVPRHRLGMQLAARQLAELAEQSRLHAPSNAALKGGVRGAALTFAGNLLVRCVLSYARQQASKLLAAPAVTSPQDDEP